MSALRIGRFVRRAARELWRNALICTCGHAATLHLHGRTCTAHARTANRLLMCGCHAFRRRAAP